MSWQILEGVNDISIKMFEANTDLDAGPIYLQQNISLAGDELVDEWRFLQARPMINLCLAWFDFNNFLEWPTSRV